MIPIHKSRSLDPERTLRSGAQAEARSLTRLLDLTEPCQIKPELLQLIWRLLLRLPNLT